MSSKLLAIKIRRRDVSAAIFSGRNLEHLTALQLCDEPEAVTDAIARFLATILENFYPDSAVIGISKTKAGDRVASLLETTEAMLRSEAIPFWKIEDQKVLESFAVPKLKSRKQLLPIIRSFWPHIAERQLKGFEAAALGFHFQIERLLSYH